MIEIVLLIDAVLVALVAVFGIIYILYVLYEDKRK